MENIELLIEKVKKCNLSDTDKKLLLEKLERKKPDMDGFIQTFVTICKVSKEVLKLFDINIGDIF